MATTYSGSTTGRLLSTRPGAQGRMHARMADNPERCSCATHGITYLGRPSECPMCAAEDQIVELRDALKTVTNESNALHNEVQLLRVQVDYIEAMRAAMDVTDDGDRTFLKGVLYQFRDDRSVAMKVTHGGSKKGKKTWPNGFLVLPRKGEPYGYVCTSMGGQAIASYYDEATRTHGNATAMSMLVRAWNATLAGGLDGT